MAAALQPNGLGELSENILQNLPNMLPPETVFYLPKARTVTLVPTKLYPFAVEYSVFHPLVRHVLLYFLCELQGPAWAIGTYSSSPQAGGIPQILIF